MNLMLGKKSVLGYAVLATFCIFTAGGTVGTADEHNVKDVSEAYIPLPDGVRDALIELGVKDPFVVYAVDFNGDMVALLPSGVTVEPVTFPLETELLENAAGVTIIRLQASESTMTCRWPPRAGDPPCSKQTKN